MTKTRLLASEYPRKEVNTKGICPVDVENSISSGALLVLDRAIQIHYKAEVACSAGHPLLNCLLVLSSKDGQLDGNSR